MGKLYIVPTPIGNLEDMTFRAVRILREVGLIAAEDTRTTGRLLAHFQIETPQISYHEHNKLSRLDRVLQGLTEGDVALVSDAGTPGLSDPGYELVRAVLTEGLDVVPLPGPTALIPAVVASGLPTDAFLYLGFPPRKSSARQTLLESVIEIPYTLVFYEAPHRIIDTLKDLSRVLGDREISIGREISKLYEEFWRGLISEGILHFTEKAPRGEFVLVVAGSSPAEASVWDESEVREALIERLNQGEPRNAAAKAVAADSGWAKRDVYNLDT